MEVLSDMENHFGWIATFKGIPIQGVFAGTEHVAWRQLLEHLEVPKHIAYGRGYRVTQIYYNWAELVNGIK